MKETLNVNIGSVAFTIDEDACRVLRNYLDDIRKRLPENDAETMEDIERRIAEIFRERVASPMRVVTLDTVQAAMAQMGAPEEFGPGGADKSRDDAADAGPEPAARRLYRSRSNRMIAGICGGIGEFFDADPTVIRLVSVLLAIFGGLSFWVYVVLWIVIPNQPGEAARR